MTLARVSVLVLAASLVACGGDAAPGGDAGAPRVDSSVPPGTDSSVPPGTDSGTPVSVDSGTPEGCESGPLALPIAGCMPEPLPSTGDPAQDCVDRINQFRWECQCLPPLMRWTDGEACASSNAEYDSTRSPHDGFRSGMCESGSGQNECPGWGSIDQTISGCLQQMWDEGPGEPFIEHGHYLNMTNSSFTMVACGFYEGPTGVWAVQNFR